MSKIILASESLRRQDLLRQISIPFEVVVSGFDEESFIAEQAVFLSPSKLAGALAAQKAHAVSAKQESSAFILAADTVVVFEDKIFGKPKDTADAAGMLYALRKNTHTVITGGALLYRQNIVQFSAEANVTLRDMTDNEIRDYVASGEPFGKAGGYAIQEKGAVFVTHIQGDYYAVVGLPLAPLYAAFLRLGYQIMENWK